MAGAMRLDPCPIWLKLVFGAALAAMPSALAAQTSGKATYAGSPPSVVLGVNVTASVSASCAFTTGNTPNGTYNVGAVDRAFLVDVAFSLRCNSPSRVGVVSANGGMLAENVASVPNGYARLAPYQVTLKLAGNSGTTAQSTCDAAQLLSSASGCNFRGPASPTQGLRLSGPSSDASGSFIRISSQGYTASPILIASNQYADRLTVTISPAT